MESISSTGSDGFYVDDEKHSYLTSMIIKLGSELTPHMVEGYVEQCLKAASVAAQMKVQEQFSEELRSGLEDQSGGQIGLRGDRILDRLLAAQQLPPPIRAADLGATFAPAPPDIPEGTA